jgi:hypothetical protein
VLFCIYNFKDDQMKKQKKKKQPLFELAAGCTQPPFQLAAAARQPPATQSGLPPLLQPAALCCSGRSLPPPFAAVGPYHRFKRRQEPNRCGKRRFEAIFANVESDYLFS